MCYMHIYIYIYICVCSYSCINIVSIIIISSSSSRSSIIKYHERVADGGGQTCGGGPRKKIAVPQRGIRKGGSGKKVTFKWLKSDLKDKFKVICWSDPPFRISLLGTVKKKQKCKKVTLRHKTIRSYLSDDFPEARSFYSRRHRQKDVCLRVLL